MGVMHGREAVEQFIIARNERHGMSLVDWFPLRLTAYGTSRGNTAL